MRGGALGPQLPSVRLRHPRIVGDVVGSQHVSRPSVNFFVVVKGVLDLFDIDGLVVLVQQLYLVLSQEQNDLVLYMLLFESL